MHRARAARGQQASWKDAATWPPGRPARRMGILDVGRQATSLGHLSALQVPSSEPSSRREGARPAVAISGPPRHTCSCSLAPPACTARGFAAHCRLRSALLVAVSPDQQRGKRTAFLTRLAARLTTAQSRPRRHVCNPPSSGSRASTRGRQGADSKAGADSRAAPGDAVQSPRASAAKDRTPPVLGLRMPQATEPRQAHRTSVLTGDPPHPFPELRQHLQVGHDRGLQLQRERLGCCDQRPVCEGQSPAHAPQGGAANRCASLSNTGPQAWGRPHGGTGRTVRGSPPVA